MIRRSPRGLFLGHGGPRVTLAVTVRRMGHMATISKRLRGGRVRWLAQVRRVDSQYFSRTFDTRREAEEWARSEETRIDRGDRPVADRRAAR
jgi:hypothetical protein